MTELYQKLEEIVSKKYISNSLYVRHAYSRNVDPVLQGVPDIALDISKERIKEAIDTGAQILTTSCPFCIGNLSEAYKEMESEIQDKITVIDIIDLIAKKI